MVFGQSRSRENDLPDEVPARFLNVSTEEAPNPVAFTVTVPRTDFVVAAESVAIQKVHPPMSVKNEVTVRDQSCWKTTFNFT